MKDSPKVNPFLSLLIIKSTVKGNTAKLAIRHHKEKKKKKSHIFLNKLEILFDSILLFLILFNFRSHRPIMKIFL